ncbi:tail fiber protein [Pseudomonas phage PCS5]|nr:tail fiber protein [Pseudomonas phage PCS5]
MGLVSQSVKNLKGGISQQPDILRFPNQGAQQINGWSSETQGLQKRPPSTFVKRLGVTGMWGAKPLVHLVNRDAVEQYYMVFTGTGVAVMDLKGNQYTVRGYDGYANCADPRADLRLITVADYTFVVNRRTTVGMSGELTHAGYRDLNTRAVVACRGGQYGRTVTVEVLIDVTWVRLAELKLPSGVGEPGQIEPMVAQVDAQNMIRAMVDQVNVNGAPWKITAGEYAGCMLLHRDDGGIFNGIRTKDGYADQLINGFIYQVQSFNKLPAQAPEGYLVEITGEATRSGDNYWVRYDGAQRVWKETVKPGIIAGLNPVTMPRGLVRAADGQFDWKVLEWAKRNAGDDETNPMPSFVDGTINDVFFFRNRLGFLSGENVIMSRASRYFNFFPPSVASLSDDDPLDIAVSHNRISILKYAVPFSEQLLLWSDQAQFVLSSQGILSPKTVKLNLTTEFDVQDTARPFGIGRGVYFSAPRAAYTSLKRYYAVQDVSDVNNAEDVSAHVPSYIENRVFNIHGSGTENYVTLLSDGASDRIYIYKFLYMAEEIAQQAWSHWEFGKANILACASIGSYMYLLLDRPEGVVLERLEFTAYTKDFPQEPYRTYMDSKVSVVCSSFDEDTFRSAMSLQLIYGGIPSPDSIFWSIDTQGVATLHEPPAGGWAADSNIYLQGDHRGKTFIIGRQYTFIYEFSKFLIKQTADDGTTATEDIGRLQLRRAWLNYERSGAFEISVHTGDPEKAYVYTMAGGRLGSEVILGELNLGTGQYKFPVTGNAMRQIVTIASDTPNPLNVIGCGYEGNYVRRSSGI